MYYRLTSLRIARKNFQVGVDMNEHIDDKMMQATCEKLPPLCQVIDVQLHGNSIHGKWVINAGSTGCVPPSLSPNLHALCSSFLFPYLTHPVQTMPSLMTALDISLGFVGLILIKKLLTRRSPAPLPPGPKGLPIVGNIFDMPSEQEWVTFAQWGEKHGRQILRLTIGMAVTCIYLLSCLRPN